MEEGFWPRIAANLLDEAGVVFEGPLTVEPISGGVSSDIVLIRDQPGRSYCGKRALAQLQVEADWRAPVERSRFEAEWFRRAGAIVPGAAPRVIAEDRDAGVILIEYLPPERFELWKTRLLAGGAAPADGAAVGDALGRIHAATLDDAELRRAFDTDAIFDALRLDPYLRTVARVYPALGDTILATVEEIASTKQALVHGDISPKNILIRRVGGDPVFLDAETAWFGDPVFDIGFCLNHLLLKMLHLPATRPQLRETYRQLHRAWLAHLPEFMHPQLTARIARLLPVLFLARVDGKSPVEYLSDEERNEVRRLAVPMIESPPASVEAIAAQVADGAGCS